MSLFVLLKFKFLLFVSVLFCFVLVPIAQASSIAETCSCPILQCELQCEKQKSIEFYSEKCFTPDRSISTRSCSKPICVKKNPLPKECEVDENAERNTASQSNVNEDSTLKKTSKKRQGKTVGSIVYSHGQAWLVRDGQAQVQLKLGKKIKEYDVLETGDDGKIKLIFIDKNELSLPPNSKVEIAQYEIDEKGKSKELLNLIYGRVRSSVSSENKPNNNNDHYYKVKTNTAVAGVRGTDFLFEVKKTGATHLFTLAGSVVFSEAQGERFIEVNAGKKASYDVDLGQWNFSSVNEIDEDEKTKINETFNFAFNQELNRSIASLERSEEEICDQPKGKLNDCAWVCHGGLGQDGKCPIEQTGVYCERKRCNANGQWAEEIRLPASQSSSCLNHPVVKPCDY